MPEASSYIYGQKGWTHFTWDVEPVAMLLVKVRYVQGRVLGKMESLGFRLREEAILENITLDVLKSTEIEGETLNPEQVRSSVAKHLGMEVPPNIRSDRYVEGVVEMMLDATQHYKKPLSAKRLFKWHTSMFPANKYGVYKIIVGNWRKDIKGPMQVVSGVIGKEKLHFQAPAAKKVAKEMDLFIQWFNRKEEIDPVLKAAIAHLWFVTIHPFEDGNGRIARAITDMQLSRADETSQRFYSMSTRIRQVRNTYYDMLEKTQKGKMDITPWMLWFLQCLLEAMGATEKILQKVLAKASFWEKHATTTLNPRQKKIINKLLDGFEGKLTSTKYAKITKCSPDTALRDIQDLIKKRILAREKGGGRSTGYRLKL